ncbi:EMC6-like membrane protein [Archaeoglobus sp.]
MAMNREGLIKTVVPLILGVVAGILSFLITDGIRSRDPLGIIVLVLLIYVNKFLLPKLDVNLEGKDWAAISFMAFAGWYISWTFLLNI